MAPDRNQSQATLAGGECFYHSPLNFRNQALVLTKHISKKTEVFKTDFFYNHVSFIISYAVGFQNILGQNQDFTTLDKNGPSSNYTSLSTNNGLESRRGGQFAFSFINLLSNFVHPSLNLKPLLVVTGANSGRSIVLYIYPFILSTRSCEKMKKYI